MTYVHSAAKRRRSGIRSTNPFLHAFPPGFVLFLLLLQRDVDSGVQFRPSTYLFFFPARNDLGRKWGAPIALTEIDDTHLPF